MRREGRRAESGSDAENGSWCQNRFISQKRNLADTKKFIKNFSSPTILQDYKLFTIIIRYLCTLNLGLDSRNNTLFYSCNGCFLRKIWGRGLIGAPRLSLQPSYVCLQKVSHSTQVQEQTERVKKFASDRT